MGWFSSIASAFRSAPAARPVGRNEPCWCGSGKKYKRCHHDADRLRLQAKSRTCAGT